jgi:hypothetical protein
MQFRLWVVGLAISWSGPVSTTIDFLAGLLIDPPGEAPITPPQNSAFS